MGRSPACPSHPSRRSDEALAEAGRVLVELTVERVSAATGVLAVLPGGGLVPVLDADLYAGVC